MKLRCMVLVLGAAGLCEAQTVSRGPYLQILTDQSVTVRWRTSAATDSAVRFGTAPGALTGTATDPVSTTEHLVTLAGLAANTTYYYSVGTSAGPLAGDATYFFKTAPAPGTMRPTRVWVLGDSGFADDNQRAVRDAYAAFNGSRYTDLIMMLGDNAYPNGTDANYQASVFDRFPTFLRQSVLWSTLGNHDGTSADSATQTGPYYEIFTLPRQGEAGGLASGTEAYYSFDFGDIHFICLESFETSRAANGAMMTWLANDIAATAKKWVIAFWHHPPYSKGSHNSDTETQLIEMRQNANPILEAAGVDLVLAGHSHSYERSYLLDGHYGLSTTLTNAMKKDGGNGRLDGTGAYSKPTFGKAPREGAVYTVAGSSSQASGGPLNHPAMVVSLNQLGSVVLDVDGNRLDAKFINSTGGVADYFTLIKGTAPVAPGSLSATPASSTQVNLTWTDLSNNEDGFRIERSTDGTSFTEIMTVGPGVASYADNGLIAATQYWYRVRAYNSV